MVKRLPPMNALRAFDMAARHENLSRAAAELRVTHGAVSRQIHILEAFVGEPLFERAHGRVRLTETGALYARKLRGYLGGIEALFDAAAPAATRNLVVAARHDFANSWLSPRIGGFNAADASLRVAVVVEEDLRRFPEEADCVITTVDLSDDDTTSEVLCENWVFPVGSPVHWPGLHATPPAYLDTPDVAAATLVHHKDTTEWEAAFAAWGGQVDLTARGLFFHYQGAALEAAVQPGGLAMADETTARAFLESGRLALALPVRLSDPQPYRVAFRRQALESEPLLQAFRRWLWTEATAHRAWYDDFWRRHPNCIAGTAPPMTLEPPRI
jgi:LysR family glycine cleavage system transcriptional activator